MLFERLSRIGRRLLRGHPQTWRHLRFEFHNRPLLFRMRHLQRQVQVPGLVSVITPTCGRLETLNEAIASVDAQSYPHWEHVIVSDGHFPAVHSGKPLIESCNAVSSQRPRSVISGTTSAMSGSSTHEVNISFSWMMTMCFTQTHWQPCSQALVVAMWI